MYALLNYYQIDYAFTCLVFKNRPYFVHIFFHQGLDDLDYSLSLVTSSCVRVSCKLGHIGTKRDKYGTFQYQFSVSLDLVSQNEQKTDLKSHRIVAFGANLAQF